MRWILPASLLLLLLAAPGASAGTVVGRSDELAALEAEFDRAHDEWKAAYTAARRAGVPPRERPADPASAFWPRFEALLEGGEGRATLWLVGHANDTDLGRKERRERQAAIVARAFTAHAREPWLEELCFLLERRKRDFEPEALQGWLDAWLQGELEPQVRASGNWLAAEVIGWNRRAERERGEEIAAALHAALQAAPSSAAGRKAGRALFLSLDRELQAELSGWFERAAGEDVARPDLVAWRPRFRALAEAGAGEAELWLSGTTWVEEPDADLERLLVLADEAGERWRARVDAAEAEAEEAGPGSPRLTESLMALYSLAPERLFWLAFEGAAVREPRAAAWLIENASMAPGGGRALHDRLFARLEELVRDHGDAPWAAELADGLARGGADLLGAERVGELCTRWADATSNEEVEIRLRLQLAIARLDENEAEGVALLRELVERWPDHAYARRARGRLTSLTQLVIGQVAPDIVGPDLNGVEFRLSDYRGKVVVLDFWGDW